MINHGRSLVRRALDEHRRLVIPLAIVLILNVLAYAFFIYPLARRVSTVTERTQAAETELASARLEHTRAAATLTGKAVASKELEVFYRKVLASDFGSARRLAYPRLYELARKAQVESRGGSAVPVVDSDRTLVQLKFEVELAGTYEGIRRFIHELEQAPEFMVIDHITLSEDSTEDGRLTVQLELSTYYRDAARANDVQ